MRARQARVWWALSRFRAVRFRPRARAPGGHVPTEPPPEPSPGDDAPAPRFIGWLPIVFALLLVAMSVYAALDWFAELPDG